MQVETTYKKAISRKYPEQVVIAIAKDPLGKYNPITLGWTMITSGSPAMMAIAVSKRQHSVAAIRGAREFVISLPSTEMADDTLYFGSVSGRDVDKLANRHTTTQPALKIDCVLLADAVANFECVLESELATGDHLLFVGRIVASHMNEGKEISRLYNWGAFDLRGVP